MLINYVPGEECRVAIVEDGRLEELYHEKFASASRVGNIYVGKVMNVEPAIQAAFVDFGLGENGFLHITDLHPRYFPGEGEETTERVGLKTPRRERPLIQQALRRGDEVIVQVLKEGVGTKGPTLTSYLSIPGRFLVMMPYMDKVGVSRKVEDEEQRREMRQILDQLELPEGFGFILRTAGMDRTKTDLKRDLAYLQRLWKDMERRKSVGGKPRLLYSESDLLVRSLRDMLTNDIGEVIIDHEVAVQRASRFMKIVAPRGTTKLLQYPGKSPIFHAFNIEREIALIHAREVPLPSGGRLVIDQTEALVAIDVNSGKSRESRDAETNAYQTNIEAVDEICRQLRLRDMGGIVVNDLIDMRRSEHRKDIENRFKERMKRDRAKTTVLQISEFGILELTRQRMRPSHESTHFTDCPTCRGRGLVQKPDSVAVDALRDLAAVLDVPRVHKVELAVSARVAGDLLSHKRQLLGRIERHYGKHVDVRVSESLPVDRVSFYAYDEHGADIDLTNLPQPKKPKDLVEIEAAVKATEEDWTANPDEERRQLLEADSAAEESLVKEDVDVHPIEIDEGDIIDEDWPSMDGGSNKANRSGRRGRGGRGGQGGEGGRGGQGGQGGRGGRGGRDGDQRRDQPRRGESQGRGGEQQGQQQPRQQGQQQPRQQRPAPAAGAPEAGDQQGQSGEGGEGGGRRRRRRRRRGRGRGGEGGGQPMQQGDLPMDEGAAEGSDEGSDRGDGASTGGEFVPLAAGGNWDDEDVGRAPATPVSDEDVTGRAAAGEPIADAEAPLEPLDEEAGETDEEIAGEAAREDGRPAPQGEGDEGEGGGRRRRRRRRRRGRGRGAEGRPDEGAAAAEGGSHETAEGGREAAPSDERPQDRRQDRSVSEPSPRPEGRREGGREGGRDGRREGDREGGREGGRRDGGRREGGRQTREGRGGEGRGEQGGSPRGGRESAPPAPAPAPAAPATPKPRTLYGAIRRKLSASELNKRPKPE
jgi:ribonuclease E